MKKISDIEYQENLKEDLNLLKNLNGLKINGDRKIYWDPNPRIIIQIESAINKNQINNFLESLPENFKMVFFDNFYPTMKGSDKGAIIFAHREGGKYYHYKANHGWKGKLDEVPKSELIELIFKNKSYNKERFEIFRERKKEKRNNKNGLRKWLSSIFSKRNL